MIHKEFTEWFEEIKENAVADFGYSKFEAENFTQNIWMPYYELGLTPFESIMQHLKKIFKHQNG